MHIINSEQATDVKNQKAKEGKRQNKMLDS